MRPCRVCGVEEYDVRPSRAERWDWICRKCERAARPMDGRKAAAKRRDIPWDLEALPPMPERCPCCGVVLEEGGEDRDTSPSLDRVDSSGGYTEDNVVWVCNRCNRIKSNATVDDLYRIADFFYEEYRKRGIPVATRLRPLTNDAEGVTFQANVNEKERA